jgi:hypothetical protein
MTLFAHVAGVPVEEALAAGPGLLALGAGLVAYVRARLSAASPGRCRRGRRDP